MSYGEFEIMLDGKRCGRAITAPGPASALSHYLHRTKRVWPDTERIGPTEARRSNGKTLTVREVAA